MNMRKSLYFLLFPLWVSPASVYLAQDAALIQAAKKEGKVVWYTSLAIPSSTAIAQAFRTKYAGVDVEVHRTGTQRVLQRVMQEAGAGIKNADVIHTSDASDFVLFEDKGLFVKLIPKGSEILQAR